MSESVQVVVLVIATLSLAYFAGWADTYLKLKEDGFLLNKIKSFFNLIGRVFRGAWYSITDNKATREMAKTRQAICQPCEHRTGITCGLCGCVLKFKTRLTEEECPAKKW